jgi:PPP family 3-phenylpropionic acid transporter
VLAVITAGLIQGAHAFYYGFSALLWRKQGISAPMIGVLWGVGVAVEVGFMWFAEPWRRKVGPEKLLVLGGAAALLRWTAYAFAPPLWLLFPLQALHALTFAASFMASLRLIERLAPPQSASAAQAINSALSAGFMLGVGTLAAGPLFDAFGTKGYLAMAAMGGLGGDADAAGGAPVRLTRLARPRGAPGLPEPRSRSRARLPARRRSARRRRPGPSWWCRSPVRRSPAPRRGCRCR